jgi:hypothetical protein
VRRVTIFEITTDVMMSSTENYGILSARSLLNLTSNLNQRVFLRGAIAALTVVSSVTEVIYER